MRRDGRAALILVGIAFTAYHAARSLLWTDAIDLPVLVAAMVTVIAFVTLLCIFVPSHRTVADPDAPLTSGKRGATVLPLWAAIVAIATAALAPTAITIGVGHDQVLAPYATGYIGAVGLMMTVVMVRRRALSAWIGIVILVVGVVSWLGPLQGFSFGLVGAIMWVGVAQLLMRSLDRASRDTVRLVELQKAAAAWQAAQSVRRRERRVRVQFALQVAGPVLSRVIAQDGSLSDADRVEARVAEGALRDELRGPQLLDASVRSAIERARRLGSTVTVVDDGALADLDESALTRIRGAIAQAITESPSARIIVRSSRHHDTAVTVVGRGAVAAGLTDDDAVELWLEIARTEVRC